MTETKEEDIYLTIKKGEIDKRFQPPKQIKEKDLPDVLHSKENEFSIDVSEVKESFTWFINMADFIKTTELKCKDCALYPGCGRYPKAEQRIGFCFEKKGK